LSPVLGPRLVLAGTASGCGKTTLTVALLAALAGRGTPVASAKVGPDFIDPTWHAAVTGGPVRNLDPWLLGEEGTLAAAGAAGAPAWRRGGLLLVEGVMGLFDGGPSDGPDVSTAAVAARLGAPLVLVVDASSASTSVAAVVHGFATFRPGVRPSGVVLTKVGSDHHRDLLVDALGETGIPVFGTLGRLPGPPWPSRRLGLVPATEDASPLGASLGPLRALAEAGLDLDGLERLARSAPPLVVPEPARPAPCGASRVALASGPAFTFCYPETAEQLAAAGAEVVRFDPLVDETLPSGASGLVVPGGFPERFAETLSANRPLLDQVRTEAAAGRLVVWGECGGLAWLARSLDGHPMAGVLPTAVRTGDRLVLGYRSARLRRTCPLGAAGTRLIGHEHHYGTAEPAGDAIELTGRGRTWNAGLATPGAVASYLHVHLGGQPSLAETFVKAASSLEARAAKVASS